MTVYLKVSLILILIWGVKGVVYGPTGMDHDHSTTCEEFSRYARFNPYSVLGIRWLIFYYWASHKQSGIFTFYLPTTRQKDYIDSVLEDHLLESINWTANNLFMMDENNVTFLLVERNDRGHYWLYEMFKGLDDGEIVKPLDVRLKQKAGFVGMMICPSDYVVVMCDILNIPPQNKLHEAASTMGYRGTRGRSYLYAGGEWAPIPEIDERRYFSTFNHILD